MDKLTLRVTVATVLTVASALAYGGFYVGGISRDVASNGAQIIEMKREWSDSRKEMVALREEIARLNGILSRSEPHRGFSNAEK